MENNPMIPSNYVTLSQLQERWLKQKEQRKLKEEKEPPHTTKQPHNEETQPKIEEAPKLKQQPPPENHRSGGNRSFKKSFSVAASPEVPFVCAVSVVEGNETEITVDETNKSVDLGANMEKEWMKKKRKKEKMKKKMKKKMMKKTDQEEKEKRMEDGRTGTQGEEKAMVRDTHAPPTISEMKNKSARRFPRRRDMRFDYRPKNIRSVEKSDHAVETEVEVQDATEKSDLPMETEAEVQEETEKSEDTVEIETKLGDLCIEVGSDGSATQNNTSNRRNSVCTGDNTFKHSSSGYRSRGRIVNYSSRTISRRNSDYTGQNGVSDCRTTEYRGRGGGGYRRYGHYRESSERFNGNGRVWVKKGEVAVGSDDA